MSPDVLCDHACLFYEGQRTCPEASGMQLVHRGVSRIPPGGRAVALRPSGVRGGLLSLPAVLHPGRRRDSAALGVAGWEATLEPGDLSPVRTRVCAGRVSKLWWPREA